MPIKVLVVDDSAMIRQLLTEILQSDPEITVVGSAADAYVAREKIKELEPDVVTLDVEMPKMDGVTFLRNLMRLRPMPVVMVSSLTEKGCDITLECLALGAVDFVTKPKLDVAYGVEQMAMDIIAKVKAAVTVQVRDLSNEPLELLQKQTVTKPMEGNHRIDTPSDRIIAIGASTGGTEAIKNVLLGLPINCPGIVITQHIPSPFSASFAKRLNNTVAMAVNEAIDGEPILWGHAYVAPGDRHLLVELKNGELFCKLFDGPPVNLHKPSVDVMFRSVARSVGARSIAVLLTGMGVDGARGMEEIQRIGAHTIAQDEASSVVWGMPGEAVKRGCVDQVLSIREIAPRLIRMANSL